MPEDVKILKVQSSICTEILDYDEKQSCRIINNAENKKAENDIPMIM